MTTDAARGQGRRRLRAAAIACALAALVGAGAALAKDPAKAEAPAGKYMGREACVRCHWKMSRTWKVTAHAQAFEKLPARYRGSAECLACHATGAGREGGFVSHEKTPEMAGVQCEMCHGAGAAHAEFAMANEKKLDEAQVAQKARELIKSDVGAACIRCHVVQGHKEHPEYERDGGAPAKDAPAATTGAARPK